MNEPSWKNLKRHPLSAEYRDITGPAWMRFCLKMKRNGFMSAFPIMLHESLVVDGWQRLRACIETNIEPDFATLPEHVDPLSYVEAVNDERRHESSEERQERVARVAERHKAGESTRKIAEEESISQTQTMRDLEEARSTEPSPGSVEPPAGKVTSKDGRKRPAKKSRPRCDRCRRLYPDSDTFRPGCVQCAEAREEAKDKKKPHEEKDEPFVQQTNETPPAPIVDDNGTPVPAKLLPVFRAVALYKKAGKLMTSLAKVYKEIEACPARVAKPIDPGKQHFEKFTAVFKNARWRIVNMVPAIVCCDEGCKKCHGKGWMTFEESEAEEIPA